MSASTLRRVGRAYVKYLAFLAWSVCCVLAGIAMMTVTAIGVCKAALP